MCVQDLVIEEKDVEHSIYEVPVELATQQLDTKVLDLLNLPHCKLDLTEWQTMVDRAINPDGGKVRIAVVGKVHQFARCIQEYLRSDVARCHCQQRQA